MSARGAIERELLAWMRDEPERADEARFERLALALFAFQFEANRPYGRFCAARGATPASIGSWREIPVVPSGAFKELPLRCFPAERSLHVFRTSGTSSARRGELHLDTLELYEASLLASFERGLLPDLGASERLPMLVLAPSPAELPDSSLSHMFGVMLERRGAPGSGFFLREGALEVDRLIEALARAGGAPKLLLCGTAFAFVHLLEALERRGLRLSLSAGARRAAGGGRGPRIRFGVILDSAERRSTNRIIIDTASRATRS